MRRRKNEWQLLAVVAANGRRVWAAYQAQKLFTHVTLACEGRMVKVNVMSVDGEVDVVRRNAGEEEVCSRGHEVRSEVARVEMEGAARPAHHQRQSSELQQRGGISSTSAIVQN